MQASPVRPLLLKAAVFAGAAALTSALFINLCDLVYQCGCSWAWAGAADHCNIHTPGVRHCPWCVEGAVWGEVCYWIVLGSQALIAFWPAAAGWGRAALACAAFPVVGGLCAVLVGLFSGYWSG